MSTSRGKHRPRYPSDGPEARRAYEARYRAAHPVRVAATTARWYRQAKRIETYVVRVGSAVVYVGRTDRFPFRLRAHRADRSPWFDEATDIEHRYHATYGDSLVDEALLVRLHQPKYDQIGVTM